MTKAKVLYSVIIPTLNEEKVLPELLSDLQNQTISDFEVLVADNGSTDKTRPLAAKYGAVVVPGGLPAKARNSGAKHASGEVLFFLDADTRVPKDYLQRNGEVFLKQQLDFAMPRISTSSHKWLDRAIFRIHDLWLWLTAKHRPFTMGFGTVARNGFFKRINGYNESYALGEDIELGMRAKRSGGRFGVLPVPVLANARRYHKEGHIRLTLKLLWSGLLQHAGRNPKQVKYDWGNYDKPDDTTPAPPSE